jgi:hypothetical protein
MASTQKANKEVTEGWRAIAEADFADAEKQLLEATADI